MHLQEVTGQDGVVGRERFAALPWRDSCYSADSTATGIGNGTEILMQQGRFCLQASILSFAGTALLLGTALPSCGQADTERSASEVALSTEALIINGLGCEGCVVMNTAKLSLPTIGVSAVSAKLYDPKRKRFVAATLTDDGQLVDEADLLRAERRARLDKHGKLSEELDEVLLFMDPDELVTIWIWEAVPSFTPEPRAGWGAKTERQQRQAQERVNARLRPIAERIGRAVTRDPRAVLSTRDGATTPMVLATVPASSVRRLALEPDVAAIGLYHPGKPASSTAWYAVGEFAAAHLVTTGGGARVCVTEPEQPDDYSLLGSPAAIMHPGGINSDHMRTVAGIIRTTSTPVNSVAPDASMYLANWSEDELDKSDAARRNGTTWCREQGAHIINMSFGWMLPAGPSMVQDWEVDWLAWNPPWPLFVSTAGNNRLKGCVVDQPEGTPVVGNRSYNGLVVGGSADSGTPSRADDLPYYCGQSQNITTDHNDYELPNLVAPAWHLTVAGLLDVTGTSVAAPQVAGTAALLISSAPYLAGWPEPLRAILMASAVHRPYEGILTNLPAPTDTRSGAGALNAHLATNIVAATNHCPSSPSARGFCETWLDFAGGFDAQNTWTQVYHVPACWYQCSETRLRTVIAWDANPAGCDSEGHNCTGTTLTGDLDLVVVDDQTGATVASQTWDGSWELVDIPMTLGRTYSLKVVKWGTNNPGTYFGIAWNAYSTSNLQ